MPASVISATAVAVTMDRRGLVVGGKFGELALFSAGSLELQWMQSGHDDRVTSVSVSPDRRVVASSSADGAVRLWDLETGREQRTEASLIHFSRRRLGMLRLPELQLLRTGKVQSLPEDENPSGPKRQAQAPFKGSGLERKRQHTKQAGRA